LVAIKAHIIDDLEAKIIQYEAFEASLDNSGRLNDLVMEKIKNRVFGRKMRDVQKVIREQNRHLQAYLQQTEKANPVLLPNLIRPGFLDIHQEDSDYHRKDCMFSSEGGEAHSIFRYSEFYFSRHSSPKLAVRQFLHPTLAPSADLPPFNRRQFDLFEDEVYYNCW
jgi:hypothetical protein